MAPHTKPEYLNITGLRARGWTAAMIRDFLGCPDTTVPNPWFGKAARTPLFAVSRVDAAERTEKFHERLALAKRRSIAAKAAARRRRMEMLRVVAADEIPIPRLERPVLEARAVRHRDAHARIDPRSADRRTLNRWKVNYLRQHVTHYDPVIECLFGRVGRADAERCLRRRTLYAIAKVYPDLHEECQRQLRAGDRRR